MTRRPQRPTLSPFAILTALAAAFAGTAGAMDSEPFGLLFASTYHGEEITAADGDVYLAVVRDGGGWKTVAMPIRVSRVEDVILDAPGETTGKEVRVEGPEPLFLVRGDLEPGPVETVESQGRSLFGAPRFPLTLGNGRHYQLAVDCPGPPQTPEIRALGEIPAAWSELCTLSLRQGASVQELAELAVNRLHVALIRR